MYRFGITMRITNAQDYVEERDTIAHDWSKYIYSLFPKSEFIYIPNIEDRVKDYIKKLKINVLILSGGDDIGITLKRDKTEFVLLEYALKKKIPVIAICRGLQLVHLYFNGKIGIGNREFLKEHNSTNHMVEIDGFIRDVNSYHSNYLIEESISEKFEIYARNVKDNSVEGLRNKNILAMMWHPERDGKILKWNKLLIKKFLNNE